MERDMNRSTPGRLPRHARGFTLLEMLVVLVIIGMLAGLVGPKLFTKVDSSKQQTAQTQVKMLKGSLETLRLDINRFIDCLPGRFSRFFDYGHLNGNYQNDERDYGQITFKTHEMLKLLQSSGLFVAEQPRWFEKQNN